MLALLLSMVGLYGALSYSVSLERRAIALKLALGATSSEIMWGVGRYALTLAGVGLIAGGALTIVAGSLLRARVPVVGAVDPSIAVALVLVLLVVTTIAAWIPSRNAMRVDPATALRGD